MSTGSIYQRADGYFVGAVQINGRRKVVYGKTEPDAKKKLAALQQQAAQVGGVPDAGRRTVADLLDRWLQTATPTLRPKTVAGYRETAARYIEPAIGRVR